MGSTSVSSYSFYKPVFSSLVTSFKTSSETNVRCLDGGSLDYQQVDCFNNNFFLNGEKNVKVKPSVNNQIFGLEVNRKSSVKGKNHKTRDAEPSALTNKKKKSSTSKRDDDTKWLQKVRKKPGESAIVTSSKTHQFHETRTSKSSSQQSNPGDIAVSKQNKTKHTCQEFCKLKR